MKALKNQNRSKSSSLRYLKSAAFLLAFQSSVAGASNYYEEFIPQSDRVTIADALIVGSGTVVSHWQACAYVGFSKALNDEYIKIINAEKEDVNLDYIGMSTKQMYKYMAWNSLIEENRVGGVLSQLPISARKMLAIEVGGVNSFAGIKVVKEIFRSSNPKDISTYQYWNDKKLAMFLEEIDSNIVVNELSYLWRNGDASTEEKNTLAVIIHNIHSEVYGYGHVTVYPESIVGRQKEIKGEIVDSNIMRDAYFDGFKVVYNDIDDKSSYMKNDINSFISAISHESQHVFQEMILNRVSEHNRYERMLLSYLYKDKGLSGGKLYKQLGDDLVGFLKKNISGGWNEEIDQLLLAGGELREVAEIFGLSEDNYIKAKVDYIGHRLTPHESDAWDTGISVTSFLNADSEEKKKILDDLRSEFKYHENGDTLNVGNVDLDMRCSDLKIQ